MAFSYSLSKRRNINAYLLQSTLGNVLIWITDSSAMRRRRVDWKLYQSRIQYTRRHESSTPLWELPIMQLTDLFHLAISLVTQGRLFYLRTRIRSSLRRLAWLQVAQRCALVHFTLSPCPRIFFNILLLTLGFHSSYLKKVLEMPPFSCQTLRHMERTFELLR